MLAGWSLSNVARHLVAQGLKGAHGGKIKATTVRQMLTNATLAGYRVHRGEIVGRGNWTPILDETTWRVVGAKLGESRTVTSLNQRRAELSRLWALRERTSEEWAAAREVIDEQQTRLNIRLAELPAPDANAVDLSALPTAWPNMTLDERRQALLFARTKVTLWPAATHGKALDRRVTVEVLVNPKTPAPVPASA